MAKTPTLLEMLKAGVHFGHRTSRWHPNMEPYIFTERSGVHIINLEKTKVKLEEAGEFLKNLGSENGTLLLVGTKRQAKEVIKQNAEKSGMPYVAERWIGGTLTNFHTIRKRVEYFIDLENKQKSGELQKYTKREQNEFAKEIADLRMKMGGLVKLEKIPGAIFILDLKTEKTALREAQKRNIPVIAVCDTNVDPSGVKYPIPSNDDAVKAIEIVVNYIGDSFKEGRDLAPAKEQMKKIEEEKKKEKRENEEKKKEKSKKE